MPTIAGYCSPQTTKRVATLKILNVVIPMAGEGQRFKTVGIELAKPLIDVNGVPMFRESLKSLGSIPASMINYCFVIRRDFPDFENLTQQIFDFNENSKIIALKSKTRGATETVLETESYLDSELPLLILDCDIRFYSDPFLELLKTPTQEFCDGALLSFKSSESRFSYLVTENNFVTQTAEKKQISSDAIIGSYYFAKSDFFFNTARKLLDTELSQNLPEYYVSSVYNILIENDFRIVKIDGSMDCFGTPEELESYLASMQY